VLEAVAAARAAEELLGEADVAAHGADGGGGGTGHGGRSAVDRRRMRVGETDKERRGGGYGEGGVLSEWYGNKAGRRRGVGVKYEREMGRRTCM